VADALPANPIIQRFRTLSAADRSVILQTLTREERTRLQNMLRPIAPVRGPKLSPWLQKHLNDVLAGKMSTITPSSRSLISQTLAKMGGPR
jgi:hypothetical protein